MSSRRRYFICLAVLLMLGLGVARAENDKNAVKETKEVVKYVIIDLRLSTESNGHHVAIAPRIKVKDDSEAIIQVDGAEISLNNKKVGTLPNRHQGQRNSKVNRPFISSVAILPQIVSGTNPQRIKLRIDVTMKTSRSQVTQRISTTVLDGETTEVHWDSPGRKETNGLSVTTMVCRKKQKNDN